MVERTAGGGFTLLMWKNWLLQRRHPVQSLIEIGAPIVFAILLVVIRSLVDPVPFNKPIVYEPFNPTRILYVANKKGSNLFDRWNLAWTPNQPALKQIMEKAAWSSNARQVMFENEAAMMQNLTSESPNAAQMPMLAGVVFDGVTDPNKPLPNDMKVRIRFPAEKRSLGSYGVYDIPLPIVWFTNWLFPDYQVPGPRSNTSLEGGPPGYSQEGFLALQNFISRAIIEYKLNKPLQNVTIQMSRFPHPEYIDDPLLVALQSFVSLIFMLSFVYTSISCVRMVTHEKENQLKESMKIMGLANWLHWTAWFLNFMTLLVIAIAIMTVLLKVQWYGTGLSVFTHSDGTVIFVFLLLFATSTITFSFFVSVFFSKANTAATISGIAFFLNYSVYYFLEANYNFLGLGMKLLASLLSNTAMAFGCRFIVAFEGTAQGVQWSNLFSPPSPDDTYTLGGVMIMMVFDSILYMVLTVYIEAIFPGDFGVPQPWYFPFTAEFWRGTSKEMDTSMVIDNANNVNDMYEEEPHDAYAGVRIQNLGKVFGKVKPAVDNLSLNMFEGQITVLLGHNGAGKTTTMSMLTGLLTPTSGSAMVDGYDIRTNIKKVRENLGLCPQHNILFDQLTVKEHLIFYCRLKGLQGKEVSQEVKKYINLLDFESKANSYSHTLSGGMKRKLSVGVALCGGSKVVLLDEPTSGMDPASRRTLWDFLEKEKKGRTLLLTTHFMDEADLLGDRIAIMAGGKLQCYGSPFFLKKKYGTGYYLVIVQDEICDVKAITRLLAKYVPDIKVATKIGTELSYHLPEEKVALFEQMLGEIEQNIKQLGILSYGVSLSTMENVFVKAGRDREVDEFEFGDKNGEKNGKIVSASNTSSADNLILKEKIGSEAMLDINSRHMYTGWKLVRNQFFAMMMKKYLSQIQSWLLYFIQSVLPAFFCIIVIIVARTLPGQENFPSLSMSLSSYPKPITSVSMESRDSVGLFNKYVDILKVANHRTEVLRPPQTMQDFILKKGRDDIVTYNLQYLAGASFNFDNASRKHKITAWFSNQPLHIAPLTLDLVYNTLIKYLLGDQHSITTTNHPLPYRSTTRVNLQLSGILGKGFQYAFNIGFSFAFVSAFYVVFYVRERVTKSKHLQFVSGVKGWMYWLTAFLWDLIVFIAPVILLVITFLAFQEEGLRTAAELGRLILIMYTFAWSVIPTTYLASFLFDVPSTGFSRLTILSVLTGVAAFMLVVILKTPELKLTHMAAILDWIFLLFPHYTITMCIFNLYQTYLSIKVCAPMLEFCPQLQLINQRNSCCRLPEQCPGGRCFSWTDNYFSLGQNGIGRPLLFSFAEGVIALVALILLEYHLLDDLIVFIKSKFLRYVLRVHPVKPENQEADDGDVANEKLKIKNTDVAILQKDYLLAMRDVTKYYGTFLAVDRLSIGIKKAECFGLLGVNGAGKTTTFKMLTGDEKISSGEAYVCGYSVQSDMNQVHQIIGYCPQFDALLDDLTGRETLTIFCLLRGIPYRDCSENVEILAKELIFAKHIDKKVKEYSGGSGGNKRKLSTAVALIGDPRVLYLDEPTTGMDPVAKRHLWNVVCKARDSGKLVILTSHSMEECEALCTKVAIMVNGVFKCLGSTQHLKNKFAEGYTLIIKIAASSNSTTSEKVFDTQPAIDLVTKKFPTAELKESVQGMLSYYIKSPSIPWSRMFGIMEEAKRGMNIEDYSIGQTSLEQVFLSFTKYQNPVENE